MTEKDAGFHGPIIGLDAALGGVTALAGLVLAFFTHLGPFAAGFEGSWSRPTMFYIITASVFAGLAMLYALLPLASGKFRRTIMSPWYEKDELGEIMSTAAVGFFLASGLFNALINIVNVTFWGVWWNYARGKADHGWIDSIFTVPTWMNASDIAGFEVLIVSQLVCFAFFGFTYLVSSSMMLIDITSVMKGMVPLNIRQRARAFGQDVGSPRYGELSVAETAMNGRRAHAL
jgi:hypothetical protein